MISRILNLLILLILSALPILTPMYSFGYEQVKVIGFFILDTLLVALFFVKLIQNPGCFHWTRLKLSAGVFILVLLISSLKGINPDSSVLGKAPYYQGWILYFYLYLFSLVVSAAKVSIKKVAVFLSLASLIVSAVALKDFVLLKSSFPVLTYSNRVISTFGQPNFYSGFLLLALPFSYLLSRYQDTRWKILGWICILASLIGIIISYSRLAILLSLLLVIVGLTFRLKPKFKVLALVMGIVAVSLLVAFKSASGMIGEEFSRPVKDYDLDLSLYPVEKRLYIWPVIINLVSQKPVLGYGLENINQALAEYFTTHKHELFEANLNTSPVLIALKELNIDRSHNYLLDLLMFSGLLGLFFWTVLVATVLVKAVKQKGSKQMVLLSGLIVYLVWIQFQNQSVVHLAYFWTIIGLSDANT